MVRILSQEEKDGSGETREAKDGGEEGEAGKEAAGSRSEAAAEAAPSAMANDRLEGVLE